MKSVENKPAAHATSHGGRKPDELRDQGCGHVPSTKTRVTPRRMTSDANRWTMWSVMGPRWTRE